MPIRVLLSDDEALARERLRSLLDEEPDLEIVAECGDGKSAIALIKREKPDLVFLDIQMPETDGFGRNSGTWEAWPTGIGQRIYRSADGGKTWKAINSKAVRDVAGAQYLFWDHDKPSSSGWMGDIDIDPFDPAHVLYVTGQGVWGTDDVTAADISQLCASSRTKSEPMRRLARTS